MMFQLRSHYDKSIVQKLGKHALVILSYFRKSTNLFDKSELHEIMKSSGAKVIGMSVEPIDMRHSFLSIT